MILHLNRSERLALLRAVEARTQKLAARLASGAPKPNDEADAVILALLRPRFVDGADRAAGRV